MNLLLPPEIVSKLSAALRRAGTREIGGILMGEHVGIDTFRVKELTIQRRAGTFATFIRLVDELIAPLREFFESTNHDYSRFNYLGEWHSHHSFALMPSGRDDKTMRDIVDDPGFGTRFVVLLLVKLDQSGQLEHTVTVYQPNAAPFVGTVAHDDGGRANVRDICDD